MRSAMILLSLAVGLSLISFPVHLWAETPAPPLPALGANPSEISVSGLSSGAFMAVQYDVAFSASVVGAGIVAGGPYNCAFVNVGGIGACMAAMPLPPSGMASVAAAQGFTALGEIDSISHLATQKIYLFSGKNDTVVKQSVMDAVDAFYLDAGVPASRIKYVKSFPAGHAFIAPGFGNSCGTNDTPYVDHCEFHGAPYDQPGAILGQIYGPLQPKVAILSAQPVAFNQREFSGSLSGMADTGYVYIPASCSKTSAEKCAAHVVFHGCLQSSAKVGDDIYSKLGYNSWADSNHIIVLYPQVDPQSNPSELPYNPQGCWDWYGYTGLDFQTQGGAQLTAIHEMVQRLTSQ